MSNHDRLFIAAALAVAPGPLLGQTSALPPVHPVGSIVATSAKRFRSVVNVRSLPGGRLLVNDAGAHRVELVDSTFQALGIVADSGAAATTPYGPRPIGLLPYRGDSTLIAETSAPAFYVVDPEGKVVRTMALPSPRDANALIQQSYGGAWASTDAQGRVVFKAAAPRDGTPTRPKPGERVPISFPDSSAIRRADFATRTVETLTWYKGLKIRGTSVGMPGGTTAGYLVSDPLPIVDDFAVLSDGTIAVLRGRDYHLDVIGSDGAVHALPRTPYPWQRLTDSAKVAVIDSVRAESAKADAANAGRSMSTGASSGSGSSPAGGGGARPQQADIADKPDPFVRPDELPDYRPAFDQGALRPDARGNLWVRTLQPARTTSVVVYDVIARDGRLIDRVEVPANRAIAGFDASGAIYLVAKDASGCWLERVRAGK